MMAFIVDVNGVPIRGQYVYIDPGAVSCGEFGSSTVDFLPTGIGNGTCGHTGIPDSRLLDNSADFPARSRVAS
jgi:hypothetical protein